MKKSLIFLAAFLLAACSNKKKTDVPPFPEIPSRILKEPSGLAYDGSAFYIADWMGEGILKLESGQSPRWIPFPQRPIQTKAVGPSVLVVETMEGKLFLWKETASGKTALNPMGLEMERLPGSPFCWDGIYTWFLHENRLHPAALLGNGQFSLMREKFRPISGAEVPGMEWADLACGWQNSAALARYAPGASESAAGSFGLAFGILEKNGKKIEPWPLPENPVAITLIKENLLAALVQVRGRPGEFKLEKLDFTGYIKE